MSSKLKRYLVLGALSRHSPQNSGEITILTSRRCQGVGADIDEVDANRRVGPYSSYISEIYNEYGPSPVIDKGELDACKTISVGGT